MTKPTDDDALILAKVAMMPEGVAAELLSYIGRDGVDFTAAMRALIDLRADALDTPADTKLIERMLLSQAVTLQSLFADFAARAHGADRLPKFQAFADMAMKAQNQCRRTLATLADVRNPRRAMFVKQLNQAVNQQVNNTSGATETRKILESKADELLEVDHAEGRRLDFGTAALAIGDDADMATVGVQHRPPDAGGESS